MRKILLLALISLVSFLKGFSQPYGNEWIKYDQTYLKFGVVADGVYRIDYTTLQNAGVPLNTVKGANFQVFARAAEVPIYVSTNNTFTSSDYIEFYATHNDGAIDSNVYAKKSWQANERLSLFNDTISYFLTWNTLTNNLHYTDYANTLAGHPAKENWCWYTSKAVYGVEKYATLNYCKGKPAYQGQPIFNSDLSPSEGYADAQFNRGTANKSLSTVFPYTAGDAAKLKTGWIGKFPTDHYLELSVGGQKLQTFSYNGFVSKQADITLPSNSLIGSTTTTVSYSTVNSPGSAADINCIAYTELKYPRLFNSNGQSTFLFSLNPGISKKYLEITNFSTSGTTPVLYDMTNNIRMVAILSANGDTLKFQIPASISERQMVLTANTTAGVIHSVSALYPAHFTDFSNPNNQGDFIIISHPFFFDDGNGNNYVDQYRQFKNSTGHHAIVVDIRELYDQFAYGINLHPLSIRNFSHFIKNTWGGNPKKHIFLIGKGIEMYTYNNDPITRPHCYVPTFGYPGSDVLLTATNTDPVPQVPIGRIPALNANEIKIYLKKAIDFVDQQNNPQTLEDKAWMKRVLHLGGGDNAQDQSIFQYYLNNYKPIIEDSSYGGKVTSFFKTSSDPIQQATSDYLDSLIDNGVSLINFFGHSSYNSFDFNLDHPENYNNYKKYPVMISNGCLLGNMFNDALGLSDEFVFAEDRGAIAFIAAATFSVSNSLDLYTRNFYENLSHKNYNQSLGTIMQQTIHDIVVFGASGVDSVVMEQMGLDGDPSLLVNSHPKPDYVIESNSVSFNPSIVTAGVDSFKLHLIVTNIGKAISDSIYVDITRIYPNGQSFLIQHKKIATPYFIDTVDFTIQTQAFTSLGLNKFDIKVDATSHIDEISETNNDLTVDLLILSDDILPIYPYDFSIVSKQGVTLKASTVNTFATSKQYIFEIDTTEFFNSPTKLSYKTTQGGGVARWTPGLTMKDSTVYYWRTSVDTINGNKYSWHTSSFIYLAGSSTGWNQSHYYQFLKDKYGNVLLPTSRKFRYTDDLKTIGVYNAVTNYYGGPIGWDEPAYFLNNVAMGGWTCGGGANLMFAVIDSTTGLQWESVNQGNGLGQYGNIHCWPQNLNMFYFDGNSASDQQKVIKFIDSIPNGNYVLLMSLNDPGIPKFPQDLKNALHKIGASKIDTISTLVPYVLFSKKGSTSYPVSEIVGDSFDAIIDTNFVIPGLWDKGYMESVLIGPAVKWTSLHWRRHEVEPGTDDYTLGVYGVNNNGTETLLIPNVVNKDTLISTIDPIQYPFLKLKLNSQDSINRTPIQLDYWRINYQGVPEAALNPLAYFTFTDSVALQQKMKLDIAVENVSEYDMDSLTIKYTITDAKNTQHIVYQKCDSLRKEDTLHTNFSYGISGSAYSGVNHVVVEVNPYEQNHQPEQYHFNNLGALHFSTTSDAINPLLDVTFDGVHILDDDIISSKPEILVRLTDDNKNLALNDTSLFKIYYIYPDGTQHKVKFDNISNTFTPANPANLSKSNMAQANLKPELTMDGKYKLFVQGYDRLGNAAGDYAYQVSFEVINKSMISNVLNYPNPFTTKTKFVFVLTGSQIPSFMKIQIMTVSGKVVKEIFKDELGPIRIGRNITEYAWDGTDQYGDALANGLYLYKVVTNLDNKQLDKYDTNTDQYFKHNIGKMYLMR